MDFDNEKKKKHDHVCDEKCERADLLVQKAITLSERILQTADKEAIESLVAGTPVHPDELAMLGSCQALVKLANRAGAEGAIQDSTKRDAEGVRMQVNDSLYWLGQLYSEAYRMNNGGKGRVKLTAEFRDE